MTAEPLGVGVIALDIALRVLIDLREIEAYFVTMNSDP